MEAGKLLNRVMVQQKTTIEDDFGQSIEKWANYLPLWANVKFQTGAEFNRADKESTEIFASIRVRARNDINKNMGILYKGHTFNILSLPLLDASNVYMDIPVTTRTI